MELVSKVIEDLIEVGGMEWSVLVSIFVGQSKSSTFNQNKTPNRAVGAQSVRDWTCLRPYSALG